MRVYHKLGSSQALFVCPGKEFPTVSDWHGADGKPLTITVTFKDGIAKVADNLGRYLLDNDLAQSSPIIVPDMSIESVRRGPILIGAPA